MAWRDTLIEGKWRGEKFLYETVEGQIGRKTVLKEFPGNDAKPRVEDLGIGTRRFTLDMFVIGRDYQIERDALRKAFETAGEGQLDHPYWGVMKCTVLGQPTFTESTKLGGMCKITATFIESGNKLTLRRRDTASDLLDAANAAADAVDEAFAAVFSAIRQAQAVVNAAVAAVQGVANSLERIRGKLAAVLQVVDNVAGAIENVLESVETLVQTPSTLATQMRGMISGVVGSATSIGEAAERVAEFFDGEEQVPAEGNILLARARVEALAQAIPSLQALVDEIATPPDGDSSGDLQRRINAGALSRLVLGQAIGAVATAIVDLEFESYDQAQDIRELVTDVIDQLLADDDIEDEVYGPMVNLRAALSTHLASVANALPELDEVTLQTNMPAIVLAYQLYGSTTQEVDILARNRSITDPSSVRAGVPLKVLVDG